MWDVQVGQLAIQVEKGYQAIQNVRGIKQWLVQEKVWVL